MNNNFWDFAIQNLTPWNAVTNQPQSPQIFTEAVTSEVLQGAERVDTSIAQAKSLSQHVSEQISSEKIMTSSVSSDQANIPSPKMLRFLNTDAVEKLFAKIEGEESLPLAQTMILRELAASNDKPNPARAHLSSQSHQSGKADLPFTQQSLDGDSQQDAWPSPKQIQQLQQVVAAETTSHGDLTAPTLSQILGTTPVHPPPPPWGE